MDALPQRLIDLALEYLTAAGDDPRLEADEIVTSRGRYGLINLSQHLARVPEADWPSLVHAHFERLAGVSIDFPARYDAARPRLRVRLAPDDAASLPVARQVADGLVEVLMMKIPVGGMSVTEQALAGWSTDLAQVWADARQATLWDEPRDRSLLVSPRGHRFTRIEGSFWTSSLLLDLGRFLPVTATAGALTVIPCQDLLIFRPVDGEPVWPDLVSLGSAMYRLGPGSISPDVFWWCEGTIERVVKWTKKGPLPVWSDRFRSALEASETAA